jgi:hypothetical protein
MKVFRLSIGESLIALGDRHNLTLYWFDPIKMCFLEVFNIILYNLSISFYYYYY